MKWLHLDHGIDFCHILQQLRQQNQMPQAKFTRKPVSPWILSNINRARLESHQYLYTGGRKRLLVLQQLINRKTLNSPTVLIEEKRKLGHILPTFKITPCRNTLSCQVPRKGGTRLQIITLRQNIYNLKNHPAVTKDNIPKIRPK